MKMTSIRHTVALVALAGAVAVGPAYGAHAANGSLPSQALPITYRFRPNGDDPETSIMEIMFLFSKSPDGSHPAPAKMNMLRADQNWADAPELGSAGRIADQDTDNLMRIQRGLRTSRKPGVTLARYQESRIRHFHGTLDDYMNA